VREVALCRPRHSQEGDEIATYQCDPASLAHTLTVGAPGDRYVLRGGTYSPLDSYTQRIQGGTSWTKRTRIEAYRGERVTFLPTASREFCLLLAHEQNSYLQIGTPENLIDFDGQQISTRAGIKITNATSAGCAHHVAVYAHVHDSFGQGVLVTSTHHVQLYGSSRNNGWSTDPASANLDHGVYLGGGAWDCSSFMDTSDNAAYGVHEYGGGTPGLLGRNVIGGFHYDNGRIADRAGILLGGTGSKAVHVMSTRNQYGVHVYRTARGWRFDGYLEGNRLGPFYLDPEAEF
jgi:hypothetical protein